ncbi:MAG: FAD-dependent 5-carboxymethylaminomethyl-2-thiouridine(34) oxidoreductase MnmC [Burkholderiaceae bacterium]|nr:FAD-dependent 5-carboxymethylaminomethyl-2-thiouridine(34) oxidoreductase MnmC [Burkholderiaceae bacterium]
MTALTPHPPLAFDESGTPVSTLYGDVFRSRSGAWPEAFEVFVQGCGLPQRWAQAPQAGGGAAFTIVELGFGLGVNFLATLRAWRERTGAPTRLHYVSVEAHPLADDDLRRGLAALGAPACDIERLVAQWPPALPGLHTLDFDGGAVTLTLCLGEAAAIVPQLALGADAFFLDGFAPSRNAAMWEPALIRALARLARPGATLATWTAAGAVREALAAAGFEVARVAGHAGKRHRLSARYAPRWRTFEPPPAAHEWPARSALVVGAGLAGAAVAAGFARRGWQVTVLEAAAAADRGGAMQPLYGEHLHLSSDDNLLARLSRRAWSLHLRDVAMRLPLGKLLVDADDAEAAARHAMLERLGFPASFARQLSRDEASDATGLALPRGGLWLPGCGAAEPAALVRAWLDAPGITLLAETRVETLRRDDAGWSAWDAAGRRLASAAIVVLANAGDAARLADLASLPLGRTRGQSTLVPGERIGALRTIVSGDAFAAPLADGRILAGASFEHDTSLEPSREADRGNLTRLARTIGGDPLAWFDASTSAPVGLRCTARDRMPAIGVLPDEAAVRRDAQALLRNERLALPRLPGLFGAFAFGTRGLLWATLAARLLPALADGDPLPLETDLLRAIDPGRRVRRMLRRQRFN